MTSESVIDTQPFGWVWDIDTYWWPYGLWMKVCPTCGGGPQSRPDAEFRELCRLCLWQASVYPLLGFNGIQLWHTGIQRNYTMLTRTST